MSHYGSPFLMQITTAATKVTVQFLRMLRRRSHLLAMGVALHYLFTTDLLSKPKSTSLRSKRIKQEPVPEPLETPKKTLDSAAICLIASNEEYYLDEWLDYHLGIGFEHIYIYDNSNDLGNGWLDRRPRLEGKVTVNYYPGEDKQGAAYQHCGQNYLLGKYRWVGLFDADEYLVLKKHSNVVSFLSEYCKKGSISLSWQLHSWNGRLQYSPEPVTKRFQGMHSVDQHVKTISSVDAVDWSQVPHPHHTFLIEGYRQLDTKGNEIAPKWQNLRFPSDVAVFFHHHCKSHKEYIAKRTRGRATMSGAAHVKSRNELIEKAKNRDGFHNNTRIDHLAWNTLKSISSKYSLYDSPDLHFNQNIHRVHSALSKSIHRVHSALSNAICTIVSDDEAYIDEFVDYHAAVGFSNIYLFDSTEEHWFEQWGDERSQSAPVKVIHTPGNKTDPSFKAAVFTKCLEMYQKDHDVIVFLEPNDFIIMPKSGGISSFNELVQSSSDCATPIKRLLFGNAGQAVYDPLPVTKRFTLQIENSLLTPQSIVAIKRRDISGATDSKLESDLRKYFSTQHWESSECTGILSTSSDIVVHHYLRSAKECKRERGNTDLCSLKGTVENQRAWEELQQLLPGYSQFNDFL